MPLQRNYRVVWFLGAALIAGGTLSCGSDSVSLGTPALSEATGDTAGMDSPAESLEPTDTTGEPSDPTPSSTGSTSGSDETDPPLLPNGSSCDFGEQCESGKCWFHEGAAFWGYCGDCLTDAECVASGEGINCTGAFDGSAPHCSDGAVGEACESDAACANGLCDIAHHGYGRCAECETDAQCRDAGLGLNCRYDRDLNILTCGDGLLGESCDDDAGCAENICTEGYCSLCRDSQQCRDNGDGHNCTFVFDPVEWIGFHQCLPGELGEKCDANESCVDGWCAETPAGDRCSGCRNTSDCDSAADEVCHLYYQYPPAVDAPIYRDCVPRHSVQSDAYCDLENGGAEACEGHCVWAMLVAQEKDLGLCGECRPDEVGDCPADTVCTPPSLNPEKGSVCE